MALVPVETLQSWKSMVNTLAVLSVKRERTSTAIALKTLIQGEIDAAPARPVAAEPGANFADGDSPCVLEWGAVSLPVGDPSRITEMKLYPTLWAAIAEGALCGFDWRVYPLALQPAA